MVLAFAGDSTIIKVFDKDFPLEVHKPAIAGLSSWLERFSLEIMHAGRVAHET
jgi:hypothetical protein